MSEAGRSRCRWGGCPRPSAPRGARRDRPIEEDGDAAAGDVPHREADGAGLRQLELDRRRRREGVGSVAEERGEGGAVGAEAELECAAEAVGGLGAALADAVVEERAPGREVAVGEAHGAVGGLGDPVTPLDLPDGGVEPPVERALDGEPLALAVLRLPRQADGWPVHRRGEGLDGVGEREVGRCREPLAARGDEAGRDRFLEAQPDEARDGRVEPAAPGVADLVAAASAVPHAELVEEAGVGRGPGAAAHGRAPAHAERRAAAGRIAASEGVGNVAVEEEAGGAVGVVRERDVVPAAVGHRPLRQHPLVAAGRAPVDDEAAVRVHEPLERVRLPLAAVPRREHDLAQPRRLQPRLDGVAVAAVERRERATVEGERDLAAVALQRAALRPRPRDDGHAPRCFPPRPERHPAVLAAPHGVERHRGRLGRHAGGEAEHEALRATQRLRCEDVEAAGRARRGRHA